jgi:tetratricopeptide (TPR) repeat protein
MIGVFMTAAGNVAAGYAQDDAYIYKAAREEARGGNPDFAFLHYHSLLKGDAASPYYKDALFAVGEYYFLAGDYADSRTVFIRLMQQDPRGAAVPFAAAFLLKIDPRSRGEYDDDTLKKKIIEYKQLSLLFSDFKEYHYDSPLRNRYKAVYFIDRVEFYSNGKLFETFSF